MFFALSKILGFIIKPLFWIVLFSIIGLVRLKKTPSSKPRSFFRKCFFFFYLKPEKAFTTSLLLMFLFGNNVLVNELYLMWEPKPPKQRLHHNVSFPRIAVVLGGYGNYDIQNDYFRLSEPGDRFMVGLQGILLKKFDKIILSGGSSSLLNKTYFEADEVAKYLNQLGIDSTHYIVEIQSRSTFENAVYTKKILDSLKISQPILLITSAAHMYRSERCYSKLGINYISYPAHFVAFSRNYSISSFLIPSTGAMVKLEALFHEWVGILAYKLSGKI
jgi:uncharacterized SAM-binding protein YcdF (DUF218 family)